MPAKGTEQHCVTIGTQCGACVVVELEKFNKIWSSGRSDDWWSYNERQEKVWRVNSKLLQ